MPRMTKRMRAVFSQGMRAGYIDCEVPNADLDPVASGYATEAAHNMRSDYRGKDEIMFAALGFAAGMKLARAGMALPDEHRNAPLPEDC